MISYSARCWVANSELSKRGRPDKQKTLPVVVLIRSGCGAGDRQGDRSPITSDLPTTHLPYPVVWLLLAVGSLVLRLASA